MRVEQLFTISFALAIASFAARAHAQAAAPLPEQAGPPSPEVDVAGTDASGPPRDVLPPEYPPPGTATTVAVTGAAVFAGWYGGSVAASLLWSDAPGAKELRYPLVGPWLSLAHTGCADDDRNCSTTTVVLRAVLTVASGVGQLGGLAALGEGLFLRTDSPRPKSPQATGTTITGAPFVAGKDAFGLAVVGAF